ncbi:MAG: hypothetical protein IJ992_07350 [Lentisphaeria bacterium]|nr:hypothetical protein [Lentisphaeria bacterium]MBR2435751.1 hypothetical protein [Lentisphaeria bacterium]
MKKLLVCAFLAAACSLSAFSPEDSYREDATGLFAAEWTVFQFGGGPGMQLFSGDTAVYGLAFNIVFLEQESAVVGYATFRNSLMKNYFVQLGLFHNITEENYGLSVSLCNMATSSTLQAGLVNIVSSDSRLKPRGGVQLGVVNVGGDFQIGLLNYNPAAWFPYCPIINFTAPKEEEF